ncbi:MAG TPA: hypothetical protein VFV92_10715 [Candidatus Bathyarchaeia archaeon]|nr:hypothetical protein [Candidatus Bathyarchaeia archaeon]
MDQIESPGYQQAETASSLSARSPNDEEIRALVSELLAASKSLDFRLWLDGVYTDIDSSDGLREWMRGREVYFKIEGKVEDGTVDRRRD